MGGDADDYILEEFGIPSVLAELGEYDDFYDAWTCKSPEVCFNLLNNNASWMEYIIANTNTFSSKIKFGQKLP